MTIWILFTAAVIGWLSWRKYFPRGGSDDDSWLPAELKGAAIAYAEQKFMAREPFPLGAVVDRAYTSQSGPLILLELKERALPRAYLSDVIELSMQKLAIEGAGAGTVRQHAYVVTQSPTTRKRTAIRVELLASTDIIQIRDRHYALRRGAAKPTRADHPGLCRSCGHRSYCNQRA